MHHSGLGEVELFDGIIASISSISYCDNDNLLLLWNHGVANHNGIWEAHKDKYDIVVDNRLATLKVKDPPRNSLT